MTKSFQRFVAWTTTLTTWLVILIGGAMTILLIAEVFSRYVLNSSIYFAEEASRMMFIWLSFLSLSLAVKEKAHVGLDLLQTHGPKWRRNLTTRLSAILCILLFVQIIRGSLELLPMQWTQLSPTMGIPMFWPYLALPVGFSLAILQYVNELLKGGDDGVCY